MYDQAVTVDVLRLSDYRYTVRIGESSSTPIFRRSGPEMQKLTMSAKAYEVFETLDTDARACAIDAMRFAEEMLAAFLMSAFDYRPGRILVSCESMVLLVEYVSPKDRFAVVALFDFASWPLPPDGRGAYHSSFAQFLLTDVLGIASSSKTRLRSPTNSALTTCVSRPWMAAIALRRSCMTASTFSRRSRR
jgi:hypothetical protein